MKRLNNVISRLVSNYLQDNRDDSMRNAKICYGINVVLTDMEKFLVMLFISLLMRRLRQFLIVSSTIELSRPYLGGVHMKSFWGCFLYTFFFVSLAIIIGDNVQIDMFLQIFIYIIQIVCLIIFAPIPSRCRPNYTRNQKKKIKRRGMFFLGIIYILSLIIQQSSKYIVWVLLFQQMEVFTLEFIKGVREYEANKREHM